ncbi:YkyA family protein [Bacillus paranthracis]
MQKKLETLEKEGQELYNQIVQEGKDNNQTVKEKLNQAVKNTDEREKVLKKRKKNL